MILDVSSGNRAIWFDKEHSDAIFLDIRGQVVPAIRADSRNLPLVDGATFDLIVFDPPHVNGGAKSNISRDYGHHTTEQIRDLIRLTARETYRVAVPRALMAFKWNDHDQKLERVLSLMSEWWEPLFGNIVSRRTKHSCMTYWVMLRRRDDLLKPAEAA